MEIALLRRGKGSNHRILRKLNQEFLFQRGRTELWGEPSVTAELLRGSCGNSRPFPGPKNVSLPRIGSFPPAPITGKPAWRGGAGSSGPRGSGSFPNNLLKLSYMELCRGEEGGRGGRQLLLNPSHLGSRGLGILPAHPLFPQSPEGTAWEGDDDNGFSFPISLINTFQPAQQLCKHTRDCNTGGKKKKKIHLFPEFPMTEAGTDPWMLHMSGVRTPRDTGETPRLHRGLENNARCILQLIHPSIHIHAALR